MEERSFQFALTLLKAGKRVARDGWNGKGMFLFLVPGSRFTVNRPPLLGIYPEGTVIDYCPHIDMKTAQGTVVPWIASQSDLLSDDWTEVNAGDGQFEESRARDGAGDRIVTFDENNIVEPNSSYPIDRA